MALRCQTQIGGVVHERLVHHQPAATRHQPRMPLQQALGRQAQAGGIVGVDHHQHVQRVEVEVDFLLHDFTHDVPVAPPGFGMLGIARGQHPDFACTPQARQQLDGTLRTRHGQRVRRAVIGARGVLKPVVGFRQTRPGPFSNRRHRKRPGRQTAGQVQPVGFANTVLQRCLT